MNKADMAGTLAVVIMVVMLSIALIQPVFEARTFNKFSATKATYLDAMFSNLRVLPDGR